MKLWGGRFEKETSAMVDAFNACIGFGSRLYEQDILGSIAHATMLGEENIIPPEDAKKIVEGLKGILADAREGKIQWSTEAEDIHMNVETILIQRIGEAGKRLHTGRSRNDQCVLDTRMYARQSCVETRALLDELIETLLTIAQDHLNTIMPGYTHLQKAQPVTLAHYMMAYVQMFLRDRKRFQYAYDAANVMPLGSGALAATTYPLNRQRVAELLDFPAITQNSLDGVSDRDFLLDYLSAASLCMMHLSRFCEELILWNSSEFHFVEMDDAFSTGSSIMPQKKNPDVAELVRGKTGRVYGSLITLLTAMKGLPLAYNKDMQEDKEPVFDAIDTVELCLPVFSAMIDTLTVNRANMRKAANGGFISATDCADYLAKKGMPFREAYGIVGKLVGHCVDTGHSLETLPLEEYKKVSEYFEEDVYDALSLETCVNGRKVYGGPAPEAVKVQIENIKHFIQERA